MVSEVPGKILEIPGGSGGLQRPPGTENPGGWGKGGNQKVFHGGGYRYFLEPHIKILLFLTTEVFTCSKVINTFKR